MLTPTVVSKRQAAQARTMWPSPHLCSDQAVFRPSLLASLCSALPAGLEHERVTSIAASRYFSAAIADGQVWTFGGGFSGELGQESGSWVTAARPVEGEVAQVRGGVGADGVKLSQIRCLVFRAYSWCLLSCDAQVRRCYVIAILSWAHCARCLADTGCRMLSHSLCCKRHHAVLCMHKGESSGVFHIRLLALSVRCRQRLQQELSSVQMSITSSALDAGHCRQWRCSGCGDRWRLLHLPDGQWACGPLGQAQQRPLSCSWIIASHSAAGSGGHGPAPHQAHCCRASSCAAE